MRLDKHERAALKDLTARLLKAKEVLEDAVLFSNVLLAQAVANANAAVGVYNACLKEAYALARSVIDDAQDEFDSKSERWQESDNGEALKNFIEEWEAVSLEDVPLVTMPDIEVDDHLEHADNLRRLPTEQECP